LIQGDIMRILYLIITLYTSSLLAMECTVPLLSTYAAHVATKHICNKLEKKYKIVTEENFKSLSALASNLLAYTTPEAHKKIAMKCADLYNIHPFWCTYCKKYTNANHLEHICWSTCGTYLAYTVYGPNRYCVINKWDIDTNKHTTQINLSHLIHQINFIMFDPNNRLLVVTKNGNIKIFNLKEQKEVNSWPAHNGNIHTLCFSPDGTHMISAGDDRVIRVWDYEHKLFEQPIQELSGHDSKITALKYINNDTFVSGSFDQTARIWQCNNGSFAETKRKNIHKSISSLDVLPNKQLVAISNAEESIFLWNLKNDSCTSLNIGLHNNIFISTFLHWNRNNSHLAFLSNNNAQIFSPQDIIDCIQSSVNSPLYLPKRITSLTWHPKYNILATRDIHYPYGLSGKNSLSIWEEASYGSIQEVLFDRIFTHLLDLKRISRLTKFCRNHCSEQFSPEFKYALVSRLKTYNYTELAHEMQAQLNI